MPETNEIVEQLQHVGLAPDIARVYARLWANGPSKAVDVANASRLSRAQAYRALDELVQLGFVRPSMGRPTIYESLPPATVIGLVQASLRAREADLERLRNDIVSKMESLRRRSVTSASAPRFVVLRGRAAIFERLLTSCASAQSSLDAALIHPQPHGYARARGWLAELAARNVPVRLLVGPAYGDPSLGPWSRRPGLEVRCWDPGLPITFLLVDRRELLQVAVDETRTETRQTEALALLVDAPGLVEAQQALFEAAWQGATPWEATTAASAPRLGARSVFLRTHASEADATTRPSDP